MPSLAQPMRSTRYESWTFDAEFNCMDRTTFGSIVGVVVGASLSNSVGESVGDTVGVVVGESEREAMGDGVGDSVGESVGGMVGVVVGGSVGVSVGESVGATVGSEVVGLIVGISVKLKVGLSVGATVRLSDGFHREPSAPDFHVNLSSEEKQGGQGNPVPLNLWTSRYFSRAQRVQQGAVRTRENCTFPAVTVRRVSISLSVVSCTNQHRAGGKKRMGAVCGAFNVW